MTVGDVLDTLRGDHDRRVDGRRRCRATDGVSAVAYDSRRVIAGAVFVALRGLKADGADVRAAGASRAAPALIVAEVAAARRRDDAVARRSTTRGSRWRCWPIAFYDHPSRRMQVVGVTGTNGKTTTAYLLAVDPRRRRISKPGLLGTVTYRLGGEEREASRTTPEAPDVQQLLDEMIRQGCTSAVMEVSSHALALKRVDGMRFAAGIFTNLTRDHLDFHEDMETYFLAKRRLFEMLPRRRARRRSTSTIRAAPSLVEVVPARRSRLRSRAAGRRHAGTARDHARAAWRSRSARRAARSPVAVAARRPAERLQHPRRGGDRGGAGPSARRDRRRRAARCPACPGASKSCPRRTTRSRSSSTTRTPTMRCAICSRPRGRWRRQRLITVFGCGGDRDRTKRPLMGMVAARLSDVVVITSDNPRSEDPQRIIDEIKRGIPAGEPGGRRARRHPHASSIAARRSNTPSTSAEPGDVVLIAGKGHEKYQQIGDRVLPFDDGEVARAALGAPAQALGEGDVSERRGDGADGGDDRDARPAARLLAGTPERVIDGFAIDSRTLQPGDLFFAIVAARDGHEFVADARRARRRRRGRGRRADQAVRPVDADARRDPGRRHDARAAGSRRSFVRRESGATVVAITGSAGKTTTKETIAGFCRRAIESSRTAAI